ncbi:MAG: DUF1801 domain-containing protein [Deltaproteobacteria bacterium]|nr:MAG: DUF1801 domain-containing protein [Deltaproteobacteria bacterium]
MADERSTTSSPKLLSSGNPQIHKGDGEQPVQQCITAMPGWKHEIGVQLDALVTDLVQGVRKAVRWNTPFYGVEGRGWFLCMYCYKRHVQVSFLNGGSLKPLPPVASKQQGVRYLNIREGEGLDVERMSDWIRQASALPGEAVF